MLSQDVVLKCCRSLMGNACPDGAVAYLIKRNIELAAASMNDVAQPKKTLGIA